MAQVRLTQLRKAYDHRKDILTGIDLEIADGEFVVLLGPSGCGKTTLLRLLCGLERATEGSIELDGQCIDHLPPGERGMAMVFQNYALYPHMSVYDNLSFGLRMMGTPRAEIDARVGRAAVILKIDTLLERKPAQLSGGQRQRVAIGRAIVREPRLFLFDEPLSNLDASLRARTRREIARLHRQLGATIVYVTHDQVEAMLLGDRIVVLHEGRIQQSGTPLALYHEPCNLFVAGFIGTPKMNLLSAHVVTARPNGMTLRLGNGQLVHAAVDGAGQLAGASVTLGLRAEQVLPAGEGSEALNGRVLDAKCLGDATLLYLQLGADAELVVRHPGNLRACFDDLLSFSAAPDAFHVFDAHGQAMRRLQRDWQRTAGPTLTALVA